MIVQTQALDGTWENIGVDREHGIVPESIQLVAEPSGPTTGSFILKRDPRRPQLDVQGLAPVRFIENGEIGWSGFIKDTPSDDEQVSVQVVGGSLYGDMDPYEFTPVMTDMGEWKDNRSLLTENLGLYSTFGTVSSDGGIYLAFPGTIPAGVAGSARFCGVCIDLGEQRAAALALDLLAGAATASNVTTYFYVRPSNSPTGQTASADDWGIPQSYFYYGSGIPAQTFVRRFTGRYRYIHIFLYYAGAAWTQTADDLWMRISRAEVYTDPAFESGGYSALTADKLVADAAARVPLWKPMSWSPAKFSDLVLAHPKLHRFHRFNEGGPVLKLLDDFAGGLGNWTLQGGSTATASGGTLALTGAATAGFGGNGFFMTYAAGNGKAWRFTRKINIGATIGSIDYSLIVKWLNSNNYVMFQRGATTIQIQRFETGTFSLVTGTPTLPALVANTSYWQRVTIQGDTILGEWFNSDPAIGSPAPVGTVFYELTNTFEATNYGAGANGTVGVRDSVNAGHTFDDYRVESLDVPMVIKDYGPQGLDANAQGGVSGGQLALMTADVDDPGNAAAAINRRLGQRIRYPYNSARGWNLSGSFSVEAIVQIPALPGGVNGAGIIEYWGGASAGASFLLFVDSGGSVTFGIYPSTVSMFPAVLTPGKPYHILFSFDVGDSKTGGTSARLYVNGALAATAAYSTAGGASIGLPDLTSYPHFCTIGASTQWNTNINAPITIDELALYRGALRDHDAANRYDAAILRTVGDSKRTATPIPAYGQRADKSPNEHIASANAMHGNQFRVGPDLQPIFRPLPAAPSLEVGDWGGSKFADTSQTGVDLVNKSRGVGQDATGAPVRSTRYIGGITPSYAASMTQPSNASADINVTGWTADLPGIDLDWIRAFLPGSTGAASYPSDTGATLTRDTTAGNVLSSPASFLIATGNTFLPIGSSDYPCGAYATTVNHPFIPGRRYRIEGLIKPRAGAAGSLIGMRVKVGGRHVGAVLLSTASLSTVTGTLVAVEFIATEAATNYLIEFGWYRPPNMAVTDLFNFDQVVAYESADESLPGRRGLTISKSVQTTNKTTQAVLDRLADLYLATHQTVPFKGSLTAQLTGIRELGADVDPFTMLGRAGEMLRFSHLTDPETLATGRTGRLTQITYDHSQRQITSAIDNTRDNFGTLLSRMGVQSG